MNDKPIRINIEGNPFHTNTMHPNPCKNTRKRPRMLYTFGLKSPLYLAAPVPVSQVPASSAA
jgi:hypothetical protein